MASACSPPICWYPMCLRTTAPFLPSTSAFSCVRYARDQVLFADFRRASHHFPLRHRGDCIDVVYPFATVLIALMHRVHSQVPWPPSRVRAPALPDGDLYRTRGRQVDGLLPVSLAAPHVVEMRYRDPRQTLVFPFAEYLPFPLQNALGRRPAQPLMCLVDLGQQRKVGCRVLARKPPPRLPAGLDVAAFPMQANQARHLRH